MLPTKKPQVFTSITIATHRSSTSPSNSTSPPPISPAPEPLRLTELSSGAVRTTTTDRQLSLELTEEHGVDSLQTTTREQSSVHGSSNSLHSTNQNVTQSAPATQKRQDTEGGQFEEPLPPSQGLDKVDVTVRYNSTQSFRPDSKLSASGMGVGHVLDQTTGSSVVETSAHTGHISHVDLTLPPKATDPSFTSIVYSNQADVISGLPHKEFVPLRHSLSAASSPDEGVGLSSPPEWCDTREPSRQRLPERSNSSTVFKTVVPQERMTTTSAQPFTPRERSEISTRPFNTETPGSFFPPPFLIVCNFSNTSVIIPTDSNCISLLLQCLSCCLINLMAVRRSSMSLTQRLISPPQRHLTPPWRAPTQVHLSQIFFSFSAMFPYCCVEVSQDEDF